MDHDEPLPFGPWWEVFRRLVAIDGDDVPVIPAAMAFSEILQGGHTWPKADAGLRRLEDAAGREVEAARGDPLAGARAIATVLEREGFVGDQDTYEDPRNSFLDRVLERRRGLPITLSVLMVHLGRHAGVPLHGIGFPGHFLVGLPVPDADPVVLDPFRGGQVLEGRVLEELLTRTLGRGREHRKTHWREHLSPASGRDVVVRMLRNLMMHLRHARQPNHAAAAQRLLRLAAESEGRAPPRLLD